MGVVVFGATLDILYVLLHHVLLCTWHPLKIALFLGYMRISQIVLSVHVGIVYRVMPAA